jgi:hypothetical protein
MISHSDQDFWVRIFERDFMVQFSLWGKIDFCFAFSMYDVYIYVTRDYNVDRGTHVENRCIFRTTDGGKTLIPTTVIGAGYTA